MQDVKGLFQIVFRVQEVSLVLVLTFVTVVFIWSGEQSLRALARYLAWGAVATILLIAMLGGAVLLDFDRIFVQFHEVSFSNDLWRLNPATDRLIQMFPERFFFDAALFVGLLSIAGALSILLLSALHLWITSPRQRGIVTLAAPDQSVGTPTQLSRR